MYLICVIRAVWFGLLHLAKMVQSRIWARASGWNAIISPYFETHIRSIYKLTSLVLWTLLESFLGNIDKTTVCLA